VIARTKLNRAGGTGGYMFGMNSEHATSQLSPGQEFQKDRTPKGCTALSERQIEIAPGERVLMVGEPGTGKTMLFRAIAGLWPQTRSSSLCFSAPA
jgi:ABC-type nitrate/sulfonate/bicarbonate transport system ATPase subunit